jgi:hypothetical protein
MVRRVGIESKFMNNHEEEQGHGPQEKKRAGGNGPADAGNPAAGGGLPRALTQVRLVRGAGVTIVEPSRPPAEVPGGGAGEGVEPFTAFPMPRVPKSLADWVAIFGETFWQRHRRCAAALLLLGGAARRWGMTIPPQRCSRDSACWSTRIEDSSGDAAGPAGDGLLAGTFQTRVLTRGEDPADAPPPHDGLHFVHMLGEGEPAIHCFVRAGGVCSAVSAADVLMDDWDYMLEQSLPRMQLL